MFEEIRYRSRHGPPASWIFYAILCVAEVTVMSGIQKSLFDNPLLGTVFVLSLFWQMILNLGAFHKKMVSPKICHCYNTAKLVLYGFAYDYTNKDKETTAITVFIVIYSVADTYIYACQRWRLPSWRALMAILCPTVLQPIYDIVSSRTALATPNIAPSGSAIIEMTEAEEKRCVICLEDFGERPADAKLGCGHRFHRWCVREWLAVKNTCPTCRFGEVREG